MYIEKLASQIINDVVSGLRGYHSNLALNRDQLGDEIVACEQEEYFNGTPQYKEVRDIVKDNGKLIILTR